MLETSDHEKLREAYYARVTPLYGTALRGKSLGLLGDARCAEVALLIARCGVLRFGNSSGFRGPSSESTASEPGTRNSELIRLARARNPLEDRYEQVPLDAADVLFAGPGAESIETLRCPAVRLSFETTAPMVPMVPVAQPAGCLAGLASANAEDSSSAFGTGKRPRNGPWARASGTKSSLASGTLFPGWNGARLDILSAGQRLDAVPPGWPDDPFDCADAINRGAALVRALLLRGTPFEPSEISLLLRGRTDPAILLGHECWPWWIRALNSSEFRVPSSELTAPHSEPGTQNSELRTQNPELRTRNVLVIGCGSLGSLAALRLAPLVGSLALCDPERVSIENPVRQAFTIDDVGEFKALALARQVKALGARAESFVRAEEDSPAGERAFGELLDRVKPDLVILTTGTGAEFAMAAVLHRRGIAHVAARCYARARYFEILAFDGKSSGFRVQSSELTDPVNPKSAIQNPKSPPCYHCLRDQLHTGAAPSLTDEQKARYDPDYRPGELNAEPASAIDSGRCADVLSRIAAALLLPHAQRPAWLARTLEQERCCFIGANHAELSERGQWAHGVELPGKVTTYGPEDIVGARPGDLCGVCGRMSRRQ